jgi:hypothetical protein
LSVSFLDEERDQIEKIKTTCQGHRYRKSQGWSQAPSYSGGRDRGSKPAQANSSQDPVLKISNTKKGVA